MYVCMQMPEEAKRVLDLLDLEFLHLVGILEN